MIAPAGIASSSPSVIGKDQIKLHALGNNPAQQHLLDELVELKQEITDQTGLTFPATSASIDIYLFGDEPSFRDFTAGSTSIFADRRAFFIKTQDALNVYGFWGMHVAEDLRHEVTHGYLHSVVPNIPLWLDEGLAEYFEVDPKLSGFNGAHVQHLKAVYEQGNWQPNLEKLVSITDPARLTRTDYAEAWMWTHWLLASETGQTLLKNKLNSNFAPAPTSLVDAIGKQSNHSTAVTQHLIKLTRLRTPAGVF